MLLDTIQELKKYVNVGASFSIASLQPCIEQAVNKFTVKYIGNLHETLAEPQTEPVLIKARALLSAALANFALYLYLPLGSVNFTGAGISNTKSDQQEALPWQQVNDIKRLMLSAGHEALDQLLEFMEVNKVSFPAWAGSSAYTISKSLLVNNTAVFDGIYNINASRQTYLALQPSLMQIEDEHIYSLFTNELIHDLKTNNIEGVKLQAKILMQKAIVAYTVAKVCDEGLFTITATGLRIRFDALSTDKPQSVDWNFLKNTKENLQANARNYLTMARDLVKANTDIFNYAGGAFIPVDNTTGYSFYDTQGVASI